jgi:hypothetical protein
MKNVMIAAFIANRKIAEQALAAILRISPDFEKKIAQMGETRDKLIDRFAAYPDTTNELKNKKGRISLVNRSCSWIRGYNDQAPPSPGGVRSFCWDPGRLSP